MYTCGPQLQTAPFCSSQVWTGVTLYEYNTSLQEERKGSPSEWLKTFPLDQITGPFTCQYGSDIKPEI